MYIHTVEPLIKDTPNSKGHLSKDKTPCPKISFIIEVQLYCIPHNILGFDTLGFNTLGFKTLGFNLLGLSYISVVLRQTQFLLIISTHDLAAFTAGQVNVTFDLGHVLFADQSPKHVVGVIWVTNLYLSEHKRGK